MFSEVLVVKEVEGRGQDLLDHPGQLNAFLGTSLSRARFFSKKNIEAYLNWALSHCGNFLLLIDDYEERHNYTVFKGLDDRVATELALQRGQELSRAYGKVISGCAVHDRARIVRAAELFQNSEFLDITSQLQNTYQQDPIFREDINGQVATNLGNKFIEWKSMVPIEIFEQNLPKVARYLVEEIGVTVFIREKMGYPVEIYPGSAMTVVRSLYEGNYPELHKSLNLGVNYGYIHLDFAGLQDS